MSLSKSRIIKDDLRYLLFAELYHKHETPKAKRKALFILEIAIECLARKGFERLTLESVASAASVTRPLIKHYFLNTNDLRTNAIKYIRLLFQKLAVDQMLKESRPDKMLDAYVEACFFWVANFHTHSVAWLMFLNHCASNKRDRALNTAAVHVGTERIQSLLEQGKGVGAFHHEDSAATAKMIQSLITGAMITFASEDHEDPKEYQRLTRIQCLDLVRVKSTAQ